MSSTRPVCATMLFLTLAVGGCDQAAPAQPPVSAQQPAAAQPSTPAEQPAAPQAAAPGTPAETPQPAQPASDPAPAQEVTDPSSNDAVRAPKISDAEIPDLPVTPFPAARPMEVVKAVYVFAAKHPEVLNQVPCFCGCQNMGHRHNDDCFVKARDARGVPTAWEPHGVG
jgi:uncharacterized protein with PCYCGC motif